MANAYGKTMRRGVPALLLCLLSTSLQAQPDVPLRLCTEDEDSYPWLLKDGRGLNYLMLRLMEARLGQRILVERQPWRRCLQSLRDNLVDGAFKASFSTERQAYAHYPMRDGRLDDSRRMLTDSYHLFRRKGSAVRWDGQRLETGGEPVGAQSGFSIAVLLQGLRVPVDDGTKVADAVMVKLLRERVAAAALQTQQGDYLLARQPEWAAQVERLEPPLVAKPYFLLLSRALVARDARWAERIWDAVAEVRESSEYQHALQRLP